MINFGIFVLVVLFVFILLPLLVKQFDLFCPSHSVGKQSRSEVQEDGLNWNSTDSFLLWRYKHCLPCICISGGPGSNSIRDLPWVMVPVVNGLVCYSVFFEFCYDYYNIESVCIQMYVVFSAKNISMSWWFFSFLVCEWFLWDAISINFLGFVNVLYLTNIF